ncbi:MAG TPA: host-nuclease inhibitor Gam family protein [Acidimicrobiia bacterium]
MSEFDSSTVDPGAEPEFQVDNLDKASWAMRKYRALAQQVEANKRLAEAERLRIDSWLERTNAALEGRMDYFERHLEAFALSRRADGQKSISLPDGDIKTRTNSPTFAVDKGVFLEWAQDQKREDLIRVSLAPDLTAIKKTLVPDGMGAVDPATGEVVPGLSPVPESVSVTFAPDLTATDLDMEDDDADLG